MIDARFPTYAIGSRRLVDFTTAGELHLLAFELERTAAAWSAAADAKLAKGAITVDEQRRGRALWEAVRTDVAYAIASARQVEAGNPAPDTAAELRRARAANGVAWSEKVEALRREIVHRRTGQQGEIAKGRLTAGDAKMQLERLEAVHDLYWRLGFAFDGTDAELAAYSEAIVDYDVEQYGSAEVQTRGDSSRVEHPANTSREDDGATPSPRSTVGAEA